MKLTRPVLLSVTGGYVDTAGFLALQGLFTAHVTGNFVTFGAAIVHGTSGTISKLLALPVFCAMVAIVRLLGYVLDRQPFPQLSVLLSLKMVLLVAGCAMVIALGPFPDSDSLNAIIAGMLLVAAMAVQNALHRIHLSSAPPTTLMTGSTTQIVIDLVDRWHGVPPEKAVALSARLTGMSMSVAGFALGCGLAALFYVAGGVWCFVVPPFLSLATLLIDDGAPSSK